MRRAAALFVALLWSSSAAGLDVLDLRAPWLRAEPAQLGLDAAGLEAAAARAAAIPRCRSLLVARRGKLAFERYFGANAETLFDVRSVTKSVVSALLGMAVRDDRMALDDSIAGYLGAPYVLDGADAAVRIRDLMTMSSGYRWEENTGSGTDYNNWILSADHVQYLLDRPHLFAPGTQFEYNSAGVHLLGVALQRATGTPLPQYAQSRLFDPLGIERVQWEQLERGTVNGGSGIQLRGVDLLKFGQLFLQQGFSSDDSLVAEDWIAELTRPHYAWRSRAGALTSVSYGMLWWTSDAAPSAYFAWGYGGQFIYVVPSLELVAVATTEWRSITETTPGELAGQVLNVIVEGVVPAAR